MRERFWALRGTLTALLAVVLMVMPSSPAWADSMFPAPPAPPVSAPSLVSTPLVPMDASSLVYSDYSLQQVDVLASTVMSPAASASASDASLVADMAVSGALAFDALAAAQRAQAEMERRLQQAAQTQVGAEGCPKSVPSGTLRSGAESVGGYELCAKSVAQAATPEAAKAIQWAFSKLGTPYACMGMANQMSARLGPNYYDCSSLVASSYRHGAELPRVNPGQSTRNIIPWDGVPMEPYYDVVEPEQARPGDLVGQTSCTSPPCAYQHVVMLLADGYQLHTNSCGDVAHVTRFAGFEASNFAGVRRVNPDRAR